MVCQEPRRIIELSVRRGLIDRRRLKGRLGPVIIFNYPSPAGQLLGSITEVFASCPTLFVFTIRGVL